MRPKVFVSSTYFDLRQVRDDLRRFIDGLGYEPLLSEDQGFPIDTSVIAIENCRRRVEQDADLFVLIVGLRYGSRDPASDRSVTNIEYLAARAKGIPIYVYMERRLEVLLDLWKANPKIDLSGEVDTIDLLRFADDVRNTAKVWTSSFERAGEIVDRLRAQFAYQMAEGLKWQRRLDERPLNSYVRKLTGSSLRIALDQRKGWEHLLLAQVVRDEVDANRHLREEHDDGLALELGEDVADPVRWSKQRVHEVGRVVRNISPILETIAPRALGPRGESGNADDIAFTGRALGRLHRSALQWSRRVRTANLPEEMNEVRSVLAKFTDNILGQIDSFGDRLDHEVTEALAADQRGEAQEVDIRLNIAIGDQLIEEFSRAMNRLARRLEENGGWS